MSYDKAAIEALLAKPRLTATDLKAALSISPALKRLKPKDWFPEGTINPDAIRVRYDLSADQFKAVAADLAAYQGGLLKGWRVFPRGIPVPINFRLELEIGQPFRH
ncbi:hypothetical protein [Thermaurantiacus sp.]